MKTKVVVTFDSDEKEESVKWDKVYKKSEMATLLGIHRNTLRNMLIRMKDVLPVDYDFSFKGKLQPEVAKIIYFQLGLL